MRFLYQKLALLVASALNIGTGHAQHQPVNFTNIKVLLLHLCDFDEELCLWVMRWLAYPLRNPGAKMDRALVINGEEGTGKRLFVNGVVRQLYEVGQARAIRDLKMHAALNEWAAAQLVVVHGQFSKSNAVRLKELVTAESVLVQQAEAERARRRRNYMNLVFLSNSPEFLPVIETDPRLCVVEAPPAREKAFYLAVAEEINNGGVDAFRDFLMRDLDMGSFDQHTAPPLHRAGRAVLEAA